MSRASTGATPIVMTRFARFRSLLMKERLSRVRIWVHSSRQRTKNRFLSVGAAGSAGKGPRRNDTCFTSWIRRNASYLSRQNSGE